METNEKIIENPYGFIYITTNMVNGKKYLGKKKFDDKGVWKKYLGSGKYLKRAVELYGKENFMRNIVCFCDSIETLNQAEYELSIFLNVVENEEWYNLQYGGDGGTDGRIVSEETRRKLREILSNPSKETREKMSIAAKDRWTDELREKASERMRAANKERFKSIEERKKMGERSKKLWKNPEYRKDRVETARQLWKDPEYYKKNIDARKKAFSTLEYKIKRSDALKKKWENPEYRQRLSDVHKGLQTGLNNPHAKIVICIDTKQVYETGVAAERETGITRKNISLCCLGKNKSAGGFKWKFAYDTTRKNGEFIPGAITLGIITEDEVFKQLNKQQND